MGMFQSFISAEKNLGPHTKLMPFTSLIYYSFLLLFIESGSESKAREVSIPFCRSHGMPLRWDFYAFTWIRYAQDRDRSRYHLQEFFDWEQIISHSLKGRFHHCFVASVFPLHFVKSSTIIVISCRFDFQSGVFVSPRSMPWEEDVTGTRNSWNTKWSL